MEVKRKPGRPFGSKNEPRQDTTRKPVRNNLGISDKRPGQEEREQLDLFAKENVTLRERVKRAAVAAIEESSYESRDMMLDALESSQDQMATRTQLEQRKKNNKREKTEVHEGLPDIYDVIRDEHIAAKYRPAGRKQRVFLSPTNPIGVGRPKGSRKRTSLAREAQFHALTITSEEIATLRSVPMMERRARFHFALAQQAMACGELGNAVLERDRIALITQHLALMQEAAEKIAPYQYPRLSSVEVTGRDGAPIEFKEIDPDTMTDDEAMAAYLAMARNPGALPTPTKQIEKAKDKEPT